MENVVEAFKIAFAVLVFSMALTLAIFMFSEARVTADAVLKKSDISAFMEYIELENEDGTMATETREVGLETIIPTLYKYYKENYTVIFRNSDGTMMELYETQTINDNPIVVGNQIGGWSPGYINKYDFGDNNYQKDDRRVCSFDLDEETRRHEPWTANTTKIKDMLDKFIKGENYVYSDNRGEHIIEFLDGDGLIGKYNDATFIENVGEYTYNTTNVEEDDDLNSGLLKGREKRVIIYTLNS